MALQPTRDERLLCTAWFIALFMTLLMVISVVKLDNEFRGRRGRRTRKDDTELMEDLPIEHEPDTLYLVVKKAS